mgnify:FL=1
MKSRLFTDSQGLDEPFGLCAPDKVSVCVQMDREAYRHALERAASRRLTSGEYLEQLVWQDEKNREKEP